MIQAVQVSISCLLCILCSLSCGNPIHEQYLDPRSSFIHYLNDFEVVRFNSYSKILLNNSRSEGSVYQFRIQIHAYNKSFALVLHSQSLIYHRHFNLYMDPESSKQFDRSHLVAGSIELYPASEAYGYIYPSGQFQGVFTHNQIKYYIEYAYLHLHHPRLRDRFIIYRDTDITRHTRSTRQAIPQRPWLFDRIESMSSPDSGSHHTRKRSLHKQLAEHGNKTTCLARIDIDQLVIQRYGDSYHALIGISVLLQGVNRIYRQTDFNGDGKADGIGFAIQTLSARTNVSQFNNIDDPNYYFGNWTALYNYSSYCFGFLFIDHQFNLQVSGIANSGYKTNEGICAEDHQQPTHHFASSTNVGLMTISRHQSSLIYPLCQLIIAHEIGHLFGARHDNTSSRCSPGGTYGDYLMHPSVLSGKRKNNMLFSPCSRQAIYQGLLHKAWNHDNCFIDQYYPLCGNGILDEGEECDCGYNKDCHDLKCNPAYESYLDLPIQVLNSSTIPCRRIRQLDSHFMPPAVIMGVTLIGCFIIMILVSVFWNYLRLLNPFRFFRFYNDLS